MAEKTLNGLLKAEQRTGAEPLVRRACCPVPRLAKQNFSLKAKVIQSHTHKAKKSMHTSFSTNAQILKHEPNSESLVCILQLESRCYKTANQIAGE